jgi:eukaryotic-like serine/threonine-protein kinase
MAEASNRAEDDLFGRVLDGRYAIEGKLGEGGLGVVYRATQTRLGRPVAVKVLHAEHAKKQMLRDRFEREARSLARLAHPNIVDVIDYGIDEEAPFLVMELLEGRPLDAAIRAGLAPDEGLAIGRSVIGAVAYAHGKGVVHRDLKPGNIFLQRLPDGTESPRVLDFGLAKFLGETTAGAALTKTGAILGTPAYMSPEQASGATSDIRADVYSLGIVLYELLTGTRPFLGPPAELLRMHLLADLPSLESGRPGLPDADALDVVLRRATAKSASKRYAHAGELLDALAPIEMARGSRASAPGAGPKERASLDTDDVVTVVPAEASRPAAARPAGKGIESTVVVRSGAEAAAGRSLRRAGLIAAAAIVASVAAWAFFLVGDPAGTTEAAPGRETALEPGEAQRTVPPPEGLSDPHPEPEPMPAATTAADTSAVRVAGAAAAVARAREARPRVTATAERYVLPPELEAIRNRYRPGARLVEGDRRMLFRYSDAHRGDPRAWLLMAHIDFEFGARSDALRFYGYALREDAGARAAEPMLRDVVIMAGHRAVGRRAAAMLEETWGRDALPVIDAVLREADLDADEQSRLRELSAALRSLEGS